MSDKITEFMVIVIAVSGAGLLICCPLLSLSKEGSKIWDGAFRVVRWCAIPLAFTTIALILFSCAAIIFSGKSGGSARDPVYEDRMLNPSDY